VFVAKLLNIKIFYESHRKPLSWSERVRDVFIAKRSSGLIVLNENLKKYYLSYNKNIFIAHDAVSFKRFAIGMNKKEAREKLNFSLDKIFGVYIGSVSKLKGLDVVFEAAKSLPNIEFIIIGKVSLEFENEVFSENIKFLDRKPQGEIPVYQKAADFLIIPHPDTEYSQSPMKLFEYLASGRVIVSTDLAHIKEILPQVGNLFFEPGNVRSFMNVIKRYLEKKEDYDKEARQNIEIAKENTWKKRGEKISQFIESRLGK